MRTDIEVVARDWPSKPLRDVATITLGGTPSTLVPSFWGGEIPWMASGEVNRRHVWDVDGRITSAGLAGSNATLVDPPSVAVGLAGQGKTRGTVALVRIRLCTNQSIALIRGRAGQLDTSYLFHNLDARYEELRARSSGGGRGGLSQQILGALPIAVPPLGEQRAIAAALDAADRAVDQVTKLLGKLRLIESGLIADLVAEPQNVDVTKMCLSELAESKAGGTPSRDVRSFFGGAVPWVKSAEVNQPSIVRTEERLTAAGLASSAAKWVEACTPLVAMYGATAGAVSWLGIRATTNQAVLALRPFDGVHARWLYWTLRAASSRLIASVQGSGQPNLSKGLIDRLMVPVPTYVEQERIASILDASQRRILLAEEEAHKLRLMKEGLARDLLSGRRRIGPDLVLATEAAA